MWCWTSGLEFRIGGRTGCKCWKGKGRGKSMVTSEKTLKIVNRTRKGKKPCPDRNIKWTKILVDREQMRACSFRVIGKTDKRQQQISILTIKGKIHNNKREVKWEKEGSDWFITACTLGNHHLCSFKITLRVCAKQNQISCLWLADLCKSPAANSFGVSYYAVSISDFTSDILGHLLDFSYINIFCVEFLSAAVVG